MSSWIYSLAVEKGAGPGTLEKINELEDFLNTTDYILIKIEEARVTDPSSVDALIQEYSGTIAERKLRREELSRIIDDLKGQSE